MNINVTYGAGFEVEKPKTMRQKVESLQAEISKMPQYEPETKHYFHAGMYCREVFRHAGVLVVGKVHKKEHFYLIVSGSVVITTDEGVRRVTGPTLLCSKPGTKRAVLSETDAVCMTFHRTDCTNVDSAELELVEEDKNQMYSIGNTLEKEAIL